MVKIFDATETFNNIFKLEKTILYCLLALIGLSVILSCQSAHYPVWESFIKKKSVQLNDKIVHLRSAQKDTAVQFNDTLINLKAFYNLKGGDLEEAFYITNNDVLLSETNMDNVKKSIRQVEEVSSKLFTEWETDINSISDESIRKKSFENFKKTRSDYDSLHKSMKKSEDSITRVFLLFRDHITYLKHNLNLQSLKQMDKEINETEKEVTLLMDELNNSIKQADIYLKTHP